jgi:hypothetical protein
MIFGWQLEAAGGRASRGYVGQHLRGGLWRRLLLLLLLPLVGHDVLEELKGAAGRGAEQPDVVLVHDIHQRQEPAQEEGQ